MANETFPQETIEIHTLPHKYKKLRRASEADEDSEKCTICLSQFEIDNDVRWVHWIEARIEVHWWHFRFLF